MIGENRKEQDMMKRIAAVAAVSLVALQLGAGSAFAAGKALGKNKGAGTPATAQCSLIAGTAVISSGSGNAAGNKMVEDAITALIETELPGCSNGCMRLPRPPRTMPRWRPCSRVNISAMTLVSPWRRTPMMSPSSCHSMR